MPRECLTGDLPTGKRLLDKRLSGSRTSLPAIFVGWFVLAAIAPLAFAQDAKPPFVFDLPKLQVEQLLAMRQAEQLFDRGDAKAAADLLKAAIERAPYNAIAHYQLARAQMKLKENEAALANLLAAYELGLGDKRLLGAEEFGPVRKDPRFAEIEALAAGPRPPPSGWQYRVEPAPIVDGVALVSEKNTAWDARHGVFLVFFNVAAPAKDADKTEGEDSGKDIMVAQGKLGELLRAWQKEKTAAGNAGDLYDNHDNGHSRLELKTFPTFSRIEFSREVKERNLSVGLQNKFFYNHITLGNSSTALTGPANWRSLPRLGMTQPGVAAVWYLQYINSHLYVYPEHRDYDPTKPGEAPSSKKSDPAGHGDLFPANMPYVLIAQGSSGSDRPLLKAVATILASFRPEVKQKLNVEHILMPAVQMIFRMGYEPVAEEADYLTAKAHPTAFDGEQLDLEKMATMAHEMTVEALPPFVHLEVKEEQVGIAGKDYFDVGPREQLIDTPCAIARTVKSAAWEKRMVVSAEKSRDATGKPLTYHWVLLRGDPERVSIEKRNESGSEVELRVGYHERMPIEPGSPIDSTRVDIGVFVHNGVYYSAPAFISLSYPTNQVRVYDEQKRIVSIDYYDPAKRDEYFDPATDALRDWKDDYRYSESGELLGWTRSRGESREEFTPDGELVVEKDAAGKPTKTRKVRYVLSPDAAGKGRTVLRQQLAPE
jgi:tetratricopeptide (TPR) repeat protein